MVCLSVKTTALNEEIPVRGPHGVIPERNNKFSTYQVLSASVLPHWCVLDKNLFVTKKLLSWNDADGAYQNEMKTNNLFQTVLPPLPATSPFSQKFLVEDYVSR